MRGDLMPTKHNNSINFVHYYGAGTEHIAGGVASLPLRNKVINSTAVIHPATPLTSQQSSPDNREGKPGHYPSSQPLALTTSTAHAPRNRSIFDIEKCPELKEHGKVYRRKLILYSKLIDTENIKPPEFVARYGGKLRATYGLQRRAKEIRDKYI